MDGLDAASGPGVVPPGHGLISDDERLALLSALQELTVAALRLFDPGASIAAFAQQLAERLGAAAALCVELPEDGGGARVLGAAGLSRESLRLSLTRPASSNGEVAWERLPLPYPELSREETVRWWYGMRDGGARWGLLLAFRQLPPNAPRLAGLLERLARLLQRALSYRRLYARLEEQRTLLACENEASIEGILVLSASGKVVSSNRRFRDLWGFDPAVDPGPLFGAAAPRVAHPEGFLARVAYLETHPEQVSSEEVELLDGRTFERYVAPICSEEGIYFGQGWYFRDITARKEVDAQRRQLLQREHAARTIAEEEVRKRDEFLSIAAHELRTPLTPLALRLAALVRAAQAGQPVTAGPLQQAQGSLRRVIVLVNDLLDFSRLQSGRMVLRQAPFRLDRLVEEVVGNFRLGSPHRSFELQTNGELTVEADASRLEQVLSNLLDNAVKYSPRGGTVRVCVGARDGEAVVTVQDEGIGIPPEDQPGVFERFFRARNAPASQFGGLGLGLYLTREILRGHRGKISVDSAPGQGTTFTVALPLPG